jgi:hypothetical protein
LEGGEIREEKGERGDEGLSFPIFFFLFLILSRALVKGGGAAVTNHKCGKEENVCHCVCVCGVNGKRTMVDVTSCLRARVAVVSTAIVL